MLERFGDGQTCPCHACGVGLTYETVEADRIIPGCQGGRYVRENVRPSCAGCNRKQGGLRRAA